MSRRRGADPGCPCGAGRPLGSCCGPVLRGQVAAATAEQLMRSRYTAFALGDEAHLLASWHPATRPARVALDPAQRWTGLEVLSAQGGLLDAAGTVEFRARWSGPRGGGVLHERSAFARHEGSWRYVGPRG